MKKLTVIGILLLTVVATVPVSAQAGVGTITPMECPDVGDMAVEFECGRVSVPEDHAQPDGPTIEIAYALAHSLSTHPAPDPVIFIGGGPGAASLDGMAADLSALAPLLEQRDVIFFDQRGLGRSSPRLDCEGLSHGALAGLVIRPPIERDTALAALVRDCRTSLDAADLNLDVYTSAQVAGDIDTLREALGYAEVNLYGLSYGTRIALTMLRDRPESVRSTVLDSTLPLEVDAVVDSVTATPQRFRDLFDGCEADPVCRVAYPNLEQVYLETVAALAEEPLVVEVEHPTTGETSELLVDDVRFVSMTAALMSFQPAVHLLPTIIYNASEGNVEAIGAYYEMQLARSDGAFRDSSLVASYAVLCHEEVPFNTPEEVATAAQANDLPLDLSSYSYEFLIGVCETWGLGSPDTVESQPVHSDVPVLLLSGQYDAITPPRYAEQVHAALENSTLVELPSAAHGVLIFGDCPAQLAAQFLNAPGVALDTTCVEPAATGYPISAIPTRRVARPVAWLAALVGLLAVIYPARGLAGMLRRRQYALTATRRRAGWQPLALSAGLTAATLVMIATGNWSQDAFEAVVMIIPPVVAMQIALLVAPFNEPGLEVLLAAPRPFHWLALERVACVLLVQLPVAVASVLLASLLDPAGSIGLALLGIAVATLFLAGLAVFVTIRSGQVALGSIIMLLAWFAFMASGDHLLPVAPPSQPWSQPMALLQPFLWFAHPYLRTTSLGLTAYIYNRLIVSGIGLVLFTLALRDLRDSERLLLKTD